MDKSSRKHDRQDRKATTARGSPGPKREVGSPRPGALRSPGSMPPPSKPASASETKKRSASSLSITTPQTARKAQQDQETQSTADLLGLVSDEDDTRDFSPDEIGPEDLNSPSTLPIALKAAATSTASSSEPLIPQESEPAEPQPPSPWVPTDDIEPYDWSKIEQSYQEHMQTLIDKEQQLWQKVTRLNALYEAWARAGHDQELQRGHKRLRTRTAYVTHHEQELVKAQAHYKSVRAAFQSALESIGSDTK